MAREIEKLALFLDASPDDPKPADSAALGAIAARHGCWILEDAAQAHGASLNGVPVGAFGAFAMLGDPGREAGDANQS